VLFSRSGSVCLVLDGSASVAQDLKLTSDLLVSTDGWFGPSPAKCSEIKTPRIRSVCGAMLE
jgi:hypothetical protein